MGGYAYSPTRREHTEDTADRAAWCGLSDLRALGAVTARWLTGDLGYHPMHLGPPAAETTHLVDRLARLNRARLVTVNSQPGVYLTHAGDGQRAFLDLLCDADTVRLIEQVLAGTDLVTQSFAPGTAGVGSIAVTLREGSPCTFAGRTQAPDFLLASWTERADAVTATLVRDSWQVQVFDPAWGRDVVLWSRILDVADVLDRRG